MVSTDSSELQRATPRQRTVPYHQYLKPLDCDLFHIETRKRPMHWCFIVTLDSTAGAPRITLSDLRQRVIERAQKRDLFRISFQERRWRGPLITEGVDDESSIVVREFDVCGEVELRMRVGQMLTDFSRSGRLWDVSLFNDTTSDSQYIVIRAHHGVADGLCASGYGYLVMDGDDKTLSRLDRFLDTPRYVMPDINTAAFTRGAKYFYNSWKVGNGRARPAFGKPSSARVVDFVNLPATTANAVARKFDATQMEYLLAAVAVELKEVFKTRDMQPDVVRTMVPITHDEALRHTGNAMAFAIVNLDMASADSIPAAVDNARRELNGIMDNHAAKVLPTITQGIRIPWLLEKSVSVGLMNALTLDLDVGMNPLGFDLKSIFDVPVTGIFPFSPLIYTPISIASLVVGQNYSIGINSDTSAVGNMGEVIALRLKRRFEDDPSLR